MKKATKAALLSGLVFPGLGQLYLKRWVTGALLMGGSSYAVYTVVSVVLRVTRDITRQIESGAVSADVATITNLVTQQMSGSEQATRLASSMLLGCWIVGIVGGFLQGHLQDRRESMPQ